MWARERKEEKKMKGKAVIVGGSIAGMCCANALIASGWHAVVVEKSRRPSGANPNGAGLGLDPVSRNLIRALTAQAELLQTLTIPLTIDQNEVTDAETKLSWTLSRDEDFNFRAAHWNDLHGLLYKKLPPELVLWGHQFLSYTISVSQDKPAVRVKARVVETGETVEVQGDLLVAADGCLSSIRQSLLPQAKLRYSGYCAWRGVLDMSAKENSETVANIRKAFPDLGTCLYSILGTGSHCILYELLNKRLNWIWYVNQPEPQLKGGSVTMKPSSEMIEKLHEEADKTWSAEFAKVIKDTPAPFINVIYDADPLERLCWDKVVLIGDAAHPVTPHALRGANMSIVDGAVLGKCLERWGVENLHSALEEYQSIRLPVVTKQVLHSRNLGRMKQGLPLPHSNPFDPKTTTPADCQHLKLSTIPFAADAPLSPSTSSVGA